MGMMGFDVRLFGVLVVMGLVFELGWAGWGMMGFDVRLFGVLVDMGLVDRAPLPFGHFPRTAGETRYYLRPTPRAVSIFLEM